MDRQLRLDFRPPTYWPDEPGTRAALARIKGTLRRAALYRSITEGSPSLPEAFRSPTLSEDDRTYLGALQPTLMGGEYLPEFEPDEVEIARLDLASTTADVIAVLARRVGDVIQYRVVDEYHNDYECVPDRSAVPLTLEELVELVDHAAAPGFHPTAQAYGLIEGQWEWHLRAGNEPPEHAVEFTTVSSPFYPALSEYYQGRAQEWIAVSKTNPLPQETIAALEDAWRRAPEDKRRIVFEFLQSHGYDPSPRPSPRRGWFRAYGARHADFVLSLLGERPTQGCNGATDPASSAPRHD